MVKPCYVPGLTKRKRKKGNPFKWLKNVMYLASQKEKKKKKKRGNSFKCEMHLFSYQVPPNSSCFSKIVNLRQSNGSWWPAPPSWPDPPTWTGPPSWPDGQIGQRYKSVRPIWPNKTHLMPRSTSFFPRQMPPIPDPTIITLKSSLSLPTPFHWKWLWWIRWQF